MAAPVLAFSQGDPAGIGPELLLRLCARWAAGKEPRQPSERPSERPRERSFERSFEQYVPLLVAERAALEAVRPRVAGEPWERLAALEAPGLAATPGALDPEHIWLLDPLPAGRVIVPGQPTAQDARAALLALDQAVSAVRHGQAHALVTLPVNKQQIARFVRPDFRGHTEYLAAACGPLVYGRDYLMAFLAPHLRVALLTAHLPLRQALERVTTSAVEEAISCWARNATGRLAVAGLNPHAGEGGLLGSEDTDLVLPAVLAARASGIKVAGPFSPDTVFHRAAAGEFDWVLALYPDQGLIAVKPLDFGHATNWTMGLPFLRTSVDHGTAYDRAGTGTASADGLFAAVATALALLEERPRA